jgi:hypothetical protein
MLSADFNHNWVTNTKMTEMHEHTYQQCTKTNDRRVIIADKSDKTIEYNWLASGSGHYMIRDGVKTLGNPLTKKPSSVVKPKL